MRFGRSSKSIGNSIQHKFIEPLEQRQLLSMSPMLPLGGDLGTPPGSITQAATVTGTVTGQVTDTSGTALANANVWLMPVPSSTPSGPPSFFLPLFAQTDASGDYTIDSVPAGSYTVTAHDQGYVKNTSASFTVAAGDNTAPTVQLAPIVYGTVTGTIDDSSGNPIANARVWLQPVDPTSATPLLQPFAGGFMPGPQSVLTDASGGYTIDNVIAGTYTVTAHAQGYIKGTSASFAVVGGANTAPTLQLATLVTGTVSGLITDASGNPLDNARVWLMPATSGSSGGPGFQPGPQSVLTNASGDYTINNVVAGTYTVTARDQGYIKNTSASFTVAAGTTTAPTVALTALTYGAVTGTVTDSSGNPIANAWVLLESPSATPAVTPLAMLPSMFQGNLWAETDSTGSYSFSQVLTGSYVVQVSAKGYQSATSPSFTVATGANTVPAVQLTALVYGTVTGEITDSSGNPLADAWVRLVVPPSSSSGPDWDQTVLVAETDSSGDYTIDNVPTGSYEVVARAMGYERNTSASFTVAAGSNTAPTVALTASPAGTLPPWAQF